MGLKLDNQGMRLACGLRLGAPLGHPYKCSCGTVVDSLGRHGLSCKNAKGTFPRHEECKKILKIGLDRVQAHATLEPLGLAEDSELRPDGMSLYPWAMGKCMDGL